ncbi:MAG TPA: IclR family transcriptional regulator [Paenalcaligenes sp.]|nr:IclR family transcriptional regulator [Paenalcaligenes sp.]
MRIKQVENALSLLQFYADTGQPSTLTEIANHFDWPRSSTYNLLHTLSYHGYLYEPHQRGQFYPTPKLFDLGRNIIQKAPLPAIFDDLMLELRDRTDETVWLAAKSGLNAVFLKVVESKQLIRYITRVGMQVPLFATATGHAILSQLPSAQINNILDKSAYTQFGQGTPKDKQEVLERLDAARQRGWFFSASAFTPDLGGISLPIVIDNRIFSITTAGPWFRMGNRTQEIAQLMQQTIEKYIPQ